MPLTELQRTVCRLIAANRIASGESYVAGGVALNELIGAARLSRDIDLFHDTDAAGLLAILALAASAAVLLRRLPSLTTEGHREPGRATTPPCSVYAAPVRANAEASGDDDVDAGMRSAA